MAIMTAEVNEVRRNLPEALRYPCAAEAVQDRAIAAAAPAARAAAWVAGEKPHLAFDLGIGGSGSWA
jgi:hypothetical protein